MSLFLYIGIPLVLAAVVLIIALVVTNGDAVVAVIACVIMLVVAGAVSGGLYLYNRPAVALTPPVPPPAAGLTDAEVQAKIDAAVKAALAAQQVGQQPSGYQPGAPSGGTGRSSGGGDQYVDCPSPEEASAFYGPQVRAIGNPLWLGGDRDVEDVCVFSFNANYASGKIYTPVTIPAGTVGTLNTRDDLVTVYKGQAGLVVDASAATLRMLDDPNTGSAIYGASHRFRDACTVYNNEVAYTTKEAEAGGFVSTVVLGNFSCPGVEAPSAAPPVAPTAWPSE